MTAEDDAELDLAQSVKSRLILAAEVGKVADGDWVAFEEVHRLTSDKLFRTCNDLLSDRHDAEDALQETYATLWARAATFDQARGTAMTWMITIARNHAIDRLRVRKRAVAVPVSDALHLSDDRLSALDLLVQQEVQQRLTATLNLVEDRNRWLIDAVFFAGQSYAHLAAQIGVPIETVKSRVRRALIKAKARMNDSAEGSAS